MHVYLPFTALFALHSLQYHCQVPKEPNQRKIWRKRLFNVSARLQQMFGPGLLPPFH
jgi:hypothetical protein